MGSARERRARNTIYMIRGRPRNGDDDVDVGIDVDDETRDEECSPLKKSLSVSRTFGLPDLRSTGLEPKCMHNHLSPDILKYKIRGKIYFHKRKKSTVMTSQTSRVPTERAAYNKLIKPLRNSS